MVAGTGLRAEKASLIAGRIFGDDARAEVAEFDAGNFRLYSTSQEDRVHDGGASRYGACTTFDINRGRSFDPIANEGEEGCGDS